jgi:hypothetical protein
MTKWCGRIWTGYEKICSMGIAPCADDYPLLIQIIDAYPLKYTPGPRPNLERTEEREARRANRANKINEARAFQKMRKAAGRTPAEATNDTWLKFHSDAVFRNMNEKTFKDCIQHPPR